MRYLPVLLFSVFLAVPCVAQTAADKPEVYTGRDPSMTPPELVGSESVLRTYPDMPRHTEPVLVHIGLVVGKNGKPSDLKIKSSTNPVFNDHALERVKGYRFKPATRGGQPIPVTITMEVKFESQD